MADARSFDQGTLARNKQQKGAPGAGVSVPQGLPTCTVAAGRYILEVGAPPGTSISLPAQPSKADSRPLARALKHGGADVKTKKKKKKKKADVGSVADAVDDASELTAKAERAVALFNGVAEGKLLDPKQLSGEIDALLELLERLDREGRWEEALKLARALSGLLALLMRWAELVRSLNVALHAAQRLGDWPAVAWAKHELGTLQLAVEDVAGAERDLGEAREMRQRVGDRRGLAATDRNLQVLCRQLREFVRDGRLPRRSRALRFLRFGTPLAIAATTLLLAGGVAGAVIAVSDGTAERAGNESAENLSSAPPEQPPGQTTPGQGATNPGQGPKNPGQRPKNPGKGPTNPGQGPTNRGQGPTNRGQGPTNRGQGPTNRGKGPTNPGPGPTNQRLGQTNQGLGPKNPELGSTNPPPGSTNPPPSSTNPGPGSTTPAPGSTTPAPGSTTPAPGSTTPGPGSTTPGPGSTNPGPGQTNQGSAGMDTVQGQTNQEQGQANQGQGATPQGQSSPDPH